MDINRIRRRHPREWLVGFMGVFLLDVFLSGDFCLEKFYVLVCFYFWRSRCWVEI